MNGNEKVIRNCRERETWEKKTNSQWQKNLKLLFAQCAKKSFKRHIFAYIHVNFSISRRLNFQ